MRVLGMISGTSHDGIDVAVVDFTQDGTILHGRLVHHGSTPYPPRLRDALVAALPPRRITAADVCALDTRIGQAFADAARDALAVAPADAICSHGQTLYHWVEGATALGSLQIGRPAWIAEATGLPVVGDLRSADVAAGGQGAPLVPLLDLMLLEPAVADGLRAGALNLGGIANLTVVAPGTDPAAWDIGPANALIDAVVAAAPGTPDAYDRDGRLAASGTVDEVLLDALLAEPYYALAPPKSCGKELFDATYVEKALLHVGRRPALGDLVATLTALTAETVARTVRRARLDVLYVSGGGLRNPALMAALTDRLAGLPVHPSDALGVPSDTKEALAFALLGWSTLHGLPGNVPGCTGASGERVLGHLTPGARGLTLPGVPSQRPRRLRVTGGGA
ncbi:anhydro-N-acetylmuramic acid kinase [Streptomyces sp. VRA16 Mangrove soil]|uniref:anhydro-N-acetylmuramic acid kinase n=1 Tax=Streptomyces sp. VRA16 Mangrove soil TaxID=2817434 RepID=UPI001A9E73FC|nr:anhydro-N-acetylmuramic acid kinase [Streptomyces sp. VRA16 Mangrove soil]MBO1330089.1 anhydro-N-acetylmuramic acid kinase [Streptomyces sp. VRA16 Mangrove soil]